MSSAKKIFYFCLIYLREIVIAETSSFTLFSISSLNSLTVSIDFPFGSSKSNSITFDKNIVGQKLL